MSQKCSATNTTEWADVRFADQRHTGVRVLRGQTIIEIQRDGRRIIVDIAEYMPIDQTAKQVYNK